MKKNDKKAFTLIELIAVLVILAVIALIVTPLILNIIKSAKKSANERSVDEYGKAVELAAASYLLDTGKKANSFDVLNVEYSGNEVKCNISEVYKNNVFLSQCSVNGKEVKNAKTSDGYYHYGDATKFVDMYGDAVKKAMIRYQKVNQKLPTNLSELFINTNGLNVACNTNKINSDGTIYLSNCGLNNVILTDDNTNDNYYHYGENKYLIGDKVNYKGIEFYVIENVGDESDAVHLLKAEPLSVDEVNTYGAGHLNEYANSQSTRGAAYNYGSYGGMVYYSSETCGNIDGSYIKTDCTTDYAQSEVKYVVDAWAKDKLDINGLVKDRFGYKVRLITYDELTENLEYANIDSSRINVIASKSYSDLMYGNYWYWTMTTYQDYDNMLWFVTRGHLVSADVSIQGAAVRPVINLKKSAIEE